ncbi:MAG: hypothetical protein KAS72_07835 [Phycisphaerales bacterium]|nr:hypothetical protein [Phycisphaerales bacterium]
MSPTMQFILVALIIVGVFAAIIVPFLLTMWILSRLLKAERRDIAETTARVSHLLDDTDRKVRP